MAPRISSRVCSLMPPCPAWTARAHGNTDRHRSMVLESSAYTVWAKSTPSGSSAYRRRAVPIKVCAKSAWIRQSRRSLASASVLRSEEHTSELQSLMRISYAVLCLHNKTTTHFYDLHHNYHPPTMC